MAVANLIKLVTNHRVVYTHPVIVALRCDGSDLDSVGMGCLPCLLPCQVD